MRKIVSVLAIAAVLASFAVTLSAQDADPATAPYVGNNVRKTLHKSSCQWAQKTRESRRAFFNTYEEAIAQGYIPCKSCKPDLAAASTTSAAPAAPAASSDSGCADSAKAADPPTAPFIGHKGSKKLHSSSCQWGGKMSERNRVYFNTYEEAAAQGYIPCKACKPELMAATSAAPAAPAASSDSGCAASKSSAAPATAPFIGHKGSKKLHASSCQWGQKMSARNKVFFNTYEEAVAAGYTPCKSCKPDLSAAATSVVPASAPAAEAAAAPAKAESEYWASGKGKTFHRPSCEWGKKISPDNLVKHKTRDEAIAAGKKACKVCKP